MHDCLWLGCKRRIPAEFAMCREHWGMLPEWIRTAIWRSYVPGQTIETASRGWRIAIQDAEAWVRATFGGEVREKYNPGKWETLRRTVADNDARRARHRATEKASLEDLRSYLDGLLSLWRRRLDRMFGPRLAATLTEERIITRPHCRIESSRSEE